METDKLVALEGVEETDVLPVLDRLKELVEHTEKVGELDCVVLPVMQAVRERLRERVTVDEWVRVTLTEVVGVMDAQRVAE